MGADKDAVMHMATSGWLASIVGISDPDFCNAVKAQCPWMTVVARQVWTDSDPMPFLNGEEAHDRAVAHSWYFGPLHDHTLRCRKDVFIQLVNEQSYPHDGYFYDELMALAEAEGYRLCICNDSGGAPGDQDGMRALWFDASGHPQSDFLVSGRRIAYRRARRNGHIYGDHSYGNITDGLYHRSDEIGAWPWFSGRPFEKNRLFAPEDRPKMLITEFGSGATQFTQALGFDEFWSNYEGFRNRALEKYPDQMSNLLGICQWSVGNAPGFPGQYIDNWLPMIIEKQRRV